MYCVSAPWRDVSNYRIRMSGSGLIGRMLAWFLGAVLAAGCAARGPLDLPNYDTMAPPLPQIAVLALPGGLASCSGASCTPVPVASLRQALAASDRFTSVGARAEEAEYVLAIAALTDRRVVRVQAQLYWFDQRVETIAFDLAGAGADAERAEHIAAHLIKRFQDHETFAAATLHDALQSSRYADTLRAAPTIGAFTYAGMQVLHNPMHGASIRYLHSGYDNVHADVFVYPIAHPVFDDNARLDDELRVLQRDFRQLEARGWWLELKLQPARAETLPAPDGGRVLVLDGEFRTDNDLIATSAYVFRRGDKYVKVRASYSRFAPVREDVEAFVKALPASLETPAESAFMAGLRRRWREAGFQPN